MVRRLSHCCCFTVRTGAIILACLGLFSSIFNVVVYSVLIDNEENIDQLIGSIEDNVKRSYEQGQMGRDQFETAIRLCQMAREYIPTFLISCVVVAAICFLKNTFLLTGVLYNKRFFMLPWLVVAIAFLCINLLVVLAYPFVTGFYASSVAASAISLLFVALGFYYWHCVYSHYLDLRDQAQLSHDKVPLVIEEAIPYAK